MKRFSAFDPRAVTALGLMEEIRLGLNASSATSDLYLLVRGAVLHHLQGKIPRAMRSRVDAEDILHDAFRRVLRHLDQFQASSEKSFYAWVYRVAKNLIQDQLRRRSALVIRFARDDENGPKESQILAPKRGTESQVLRRDLIDKMLCHLRAKEAEVVRLHDIEERSFGEIAAAWDKTPGAVQRFYSRALGNLGNLRAAAVRRRGSELA